jgi:hypothetical protein
LRWIAGLAADRNLTANDHSVAAVLAWNTHSESGQAWPSLSVIQAETGIPRRSVIRSIQRLISREHLTVVRERVGTKPRIYALSGDTSDTTTDGASGVTSVPSSPSSGDNSVTSSEVASGDISNASGDKCDTLVVTPVTPDIRNKGSNRGSNRGGNSPPPANGQGDLLPDDPSTKPKWGLAAFMPLRDSRVPKQLWEEWWQHRKEGKHPLTQLAAKKFVKRLQGFKDPVAAIEKSIRAGYRDVFEDDSKSNGNAKQETPQWVSSDG